MLETVLWEFVGEGVGRVRVGGAERWEGCVGSRAEAASRRRAPYLVRGGKVLQEGLEGFSGVMK